MSNASVQAAFAQGKAFIPFVTCGDPNIETTKAVVRALEQAGAALIELGIPFSDPTAEGPVIQEANIRALRAKTTTDVVFEMVRELRQGEPGADDGLADANALPPVSCPLVFMTYANVVFHYGTERFCAKAAEVGVDGLILPDVPFEEKGEFAEACARHGLAFISLIAPTSDERIGMIAREAEGFVYLVSSMGVTGTRKRISTDVASLVERIRAVTDVPVAIGFGIADESTARSMAACADGAIVGSAIVKIVAEYGEQAAPEVGRFAAAMVEAVRGA